MVRATGTEMPDSDLLMLDMGTEIRHRQPRMEVFKMNDLLKIISNTSSPEEIEQIIQGVLTGKIRKDYAGKLSPIQYEITWHRAMELPDKLNKEECLGQRDWYLPDFIEMVLMFDRKTGKPVPGCEDMKNSCFWSSSSYERLMLSAWFMDFHNGSTGNISKYSGFAARCVRP